MRCDNFDDDQHKLMIVLLFSLDLLSRFDLPLKPILAERVQVTVYCGTEIVADFSATLNLSDSKLSTV